MEQAAQVGDLPLLEHGPGMSVAGFLSVLAREGGSRCRACYRLRLEATARRAAEEGMEGFSSTLLISPYQDVGEIAEVGERAARRHGVAFRFADLRDRYPESCERAREHDLYRQSYCGCAFSALERGERRSRRAIASARRAAA
jgi:predicted adenine nucleotide alpha hydrolase (AANH) superfamily ATPase